MKVNILMRSQPGPRLVL